MYSVTAVVYLGEERFTARVLNVSSGGLLLIAPVDAPLATRLRLNLTLPGLDQIVDVQADITRDERVEGYRAWGVRLVEPAPDTAILLQTYVDWVAERDGPLVASPLRGTALDRTKTGPAHELRLPATANDLPEAPPPTAPPSASGPLSRRLTDPELTPAPVEIEEPDLLAELRERYRSALALLDDDQPAGGVVRGRKLPWFR